MTTTTDSVPVGTDPAEAEAGAEAGTGAGALAVPPVPGEGEALAALRARLEQQASEAGVLDVVYRTVDSPLGSLLLAATDEGLVRLAFEQEGFDEVLAGLSTAVSPRILRGTSRLDAAASQLDEYFGGRRRAFGVPIDWRLSRGFRRTVRERLTEIGYGTTSTYLQVADAAGSPRAVRAVGSACATNPIPIVVPCHRVLRSDGSLGGYLGGLDAKRTLLDLEAAA